MTKQDVINAAASATGVTKKLTSEIFDACLDSITQSLRSDQVVTLTGFGTFRVSRRAARTGVNPRAPHQKIQIPAMKLPAFKAGKGLKEAVR